MIYGMWLFCSKIIFAIHLLYVPSIYQNFVSFPVQTALGVQLGFRSQWIVYIFKFEEDLISFECYFFRCLKCFKFLIVLTTWMDPKTQVDYNQGYRHMTKLLVKITYAFF